MSLNDAVRKVRIFHQHIGAPTADTPRLLPCDRNMTAMFAAKVLELSEASANFGATNDDLLLLRLGILLEEVSEWLLAHSRQDLTAAADAWADQLYVLLGDAVTAGLPAEELFAEVHASNMTKDADRLCGPGKGLKGPNYRPPDIHGVLEGMRREGNEQ